MITSLHVQNYKCLRDVRVDLRPLTVVIGKNDTGKSSLLEAIQVLGTLVQGPWTGEGTWGINSLIFRGAEPPAIRWTVEVAPSARNQLPGKATYSLCVSPEGGTGPRIHVKEESLTVENAAVRVGWDHHPGPATVCFLEDGGTKESFSQISFFQSALSLARQLLGVPTLKAVCQALTTTIKYRFDPRRLAQDSPYPLDPGNPSREPQFNVDGYGLPTVLDYLLGAKRNAFNEIEKELHEAIPFVKTIEFKPCLIGNTQPGKSISFDVSSGSQIPAEHASDGVMLFLAYLTLIHSSNPASVILIEEPENGIHPRQLKRIAEYLKRLTDAQRGAKAVQVVVATHSPYLLDFVPPEDVLVFGRRENGETVAAPLLSLPGVQQRIDSGYSLGEMWFNVGEDRLLAELLK